MAATGTNGLVWIADTANDASGPVSVRTFVWSGVATAGDDLVVSDTTQGDNVLELKALANQNVVIGPFIPPLVFVGGLTVDTIDSGQLHVFK